MKIVCKGYSYDKKNSTKEKCMSLKCKKFARQGFSTCENHKHKEKLTDEEITKLVGCYNCTKMYLKTEDHEGTRCLECKNDAEKAKRPGCLSEKCKFQESKEFNNGYCKLHQCDYRLQEAIKKGGDK